MANYFSIQLFTAAEFLDLTFPDIEYLAGDWLPQGSSLLIGGAPKVGKSWFVYYLADAVARGKPFLKWETRKSSVVIIDCDNRPQTVQKRLALMANGTNTRGADALRIITRETFTDANTPFPNFRNKDQLEAVFNLIGPCALVILDNVNLAFPGLNENDTTFWNDIEAFVLEARKRKMTCVIVHHTKKSDPYELSGSAKQYRIFETAIVLGKIGTEAGREAHFNVVFKHLREMSEQVVDFSAKLTRKDEASSDNGTISLLEWELGEYVEPQPNLLSMANSKREEARLLKLEGYTTSQVAECMNIPRSTAGRLTKGISPRG